LQKLHGWQVKLEINNDIYDNELTTIAAFDARRFVVQKQT